MTNEELSAAIKRTQAFLTATGTSYEYHKLNVSHLRDLLEIERKRAMEKFDEPK